MNSMRKEKKSLQLNYREDRKLEEQMFPNCRITRRMKKVLDKNSDAFDKKCAICLSDFDKKIAKLPCQHKFCEDCIVNWWISTPTCPFCRLEFDYILDYNDKMKTLDDYQQRAFDIIVNKTLRCEDCWADIGDEQMRICKECRCVYIHERCLHHHETKRVAWQCEECVVEEMLQIERLEKLEEDRQILASCGRFRKIPPGSYSQRK